MPQTATQAKPVTTLTASSHPTTVTVPLPTQQPAQPKPAAFDLLGDLGGDPFAGPVNKPVDTAPGDCFILILLIIIIITITWQK